MTRQLLRITFLSLLVLPCFDALADRVKLKDGKVLEGTVIPQSYGYWIKTADGEIHKVPSADVASFEKGSGSSPSSPAMPSPVGSTALFNSARNRSAAVTSPAAAVAIWQEFINSAGVDSPELPAARAELARWKALADSGAEKIKGRWVTGEERKAIVSKAEALQKESESLLEKNQTLAAVKKLEEAAAIYPNSYEVTFTLGVIAMLQRNEDKAIDWFNRALQIRPDAPESMANLGVVTFGKKQFEKGITLLRRALEKEDRKEIAFDLITALSMSPEPLLKSRAGKEAGEAARLVASKYGITRPGKSFVIVPLAPSGGGNGGAPPGAMWSGTGFVVSANGLILTNRHVVEGGKRLTVILQTPAGELQKTAEVVVIDNEQDLALVQIKPDAPLPIVQLSPADSPADGAECTVIGYPLIDRLGAAVKITRGIVSSAARRASGPDVVIDAKVNPGNSGGPILDRHGNVMAIVSMKTLSTTSEDTYGLGISAGNIRRFLTKNHVTLTPGKPDGANLSAEEIAAKAKPSTVCILGSK